MHLEDPLRGVLLICFLTRYAYIGTRVIEYKVAGSLCEEDNLLKM